MFFDGSIKLEYHGAKVTSDGGLLACRDLDDELGLFDSFAAIFSDRRTGRNIQHDRTSLLRKKVRRYFRGDTAFAKPEIYEYLESNGFLYAIRLPANDVLYNEIRHLLS